MFLAIDVGNTHTVFGVYVDGALEHEFRMETRAQATRDELAISPTCPVLKRETSSGASSRRFQRAAVLSLISVSSRGRWRLRPRV